MPGEMAEVGLLADRFQLVPSVDEALEEVRFAAVRVGGPKGGTRDERAEVRGGIGEGAVVELAATSMMPCSTTGRVDAHGTCALACWTSASRQCCRIRPISVPRLCGGSARLTLWSAKTHSCRLNCPSL